MNKRLLKKLYDNYPDILTSRDKTNTVISCGDGWYKLIDDACHRLEIMSDHFHIYMSVFQIKEKLASLRIQLKQLEFNSYHCKMTVEEKNIVSDIIYLIIGDACNKSLHVCEECGERNVSIKKMGRKRNVIYYALCSDCWEKFKKERKESD